MNFIRTRSASLSMVVFVLLIITLLQAGISYGSMFGKLEQFVPGLQQPLLATAWLVPGLPDVTDIHPMAYE
jgi:hypothetical protein